MKGEVITFILIITVTVSMIAVIIGWTLTNTSGFFEVNEVNAIQEDFENCNDKILETARTGLSNRCIFSASEGLLRGTTNEIEYEIITRTKICDSSEWVLINPEKNIWQKCVISGNDIFYALKWNYTNIKFSYASLGNVEVTGQTGSIIEVSRGSIEDDQTTVLLDIY